MTYKRALASCYQPQAPIRFDSILANCVGFVQMGDIAYNDGQVGLINLSYNGDVVYPSAWYPTARGAVITVAAPSQRNGVAGQLPTGAATVTAGGSGYPPSATFSARLTRGDGGYGAICVLGTSAGGVVTSATLLTGGRAYTNGGSAAFTLLDQPWDSTYFLRRADQILGSAEWQLMLAASRTTAFDFTYIPDDHDHGGNNWDWSTNTSPPGATTLPLVLDFWRGVVLPGMRSIFAKYANNPWLPGTTDLPPTMVGIVGAAGTARASDIDQIYFYRDCDANGNVVAGTPGIAKIVMGGSPVVLDLYLDCIRYKSPQSSADNASKTMLGATQKAWMKARMLEVTNSTTLQACWVFSGKDTFNLDNQDGWGASAGGGNFPYTTERDEILAYIESNNVPAVWVTGDRHCSHCAITLTAQGDAYNHIA